MHYKNVESGKVKKMLNSYQINKFYNNLFKVIFFIQAPLSAGFH